MGTVAIADPFTWPRHGRVGYCRGGQWNGRYIFLHVATEDREPELAFWQAFFRPSPPFPDDELFVDHSSGVMEAILRDGDIEWAPEEVDGVAEFQIFGLRRLFAERGSSVYVDYTPPESDVVRSAITVDDDYPWRGFQ